jgi:sulfur carrier protein
MLELTINGERRELPDGVTVADAVVAAGVPAGGRGVAVAVDGEVVSRGAWERTTLVGGEQVEVLQAVQGGQ